MKGVKEGRRGRGLGVGKGKRGDGEIGKKSR